MVFTLNNILLEGEFRNWGELAWTLISAADGSELLTVALEAKEAAPPELFTVTLVFDRNGAVGRWTPAADRSVKYLAPDWDGTFETDLASLQPTVCFFAEDGTNSAAVAASETRRKLKITAGVHGSGKLHCRLAFFTMPEAPLKTYSFSLRIDRRKIPYHQALKEINGWYSAMPEHRPLPVPAAAWEPVYSSWYSYQQDISDRELETECALAAPDGMTTLIVDDGWQTDDNCGRYAYCGDWEISPRRFPDMKAHVGWIHRLGMRYLLWYSVPFVGVKSKNLRRFKGKYLYFRDDLGAWVLDPRFSEVRDFLVGIYERAAREWGIDGFKLDFIDCFSHNGEDPAIRENYAGRDYKTVPEAVARLLEEISTRLHRIKPDVLLEFRQHYFGPVMRRYGNMFRAGDCPHDLISNRLRTVDMRLLCGNSPVHSDMLCWGMEETAEQAAAQFLHVLFSVPQISVRMENLSEAHRRMLRFWLAFWREHRETLMRGTFRPLRPQWNYPLVVAEDESCCVAALYFADMTVRLDSSRFRKLRLVNGSGSGRVAVELSGPAVTMEYFDAEGIPRGVRRLEPGLQMVDVPISGLLRN